MAKIKLIQLSFMQYMGLRVFSLGVSLMMIVRICVLIIIIKSEEGHVCHFLGLGNDTMVCVICLSIFLRKRCHVMTLSCILED